MRDYYFEDKGVFEVWLVRDDHKGIAYTDNGEIVITKHCEVEDKAAVEDFAMEYGIDLSAEQVEFFRG